MSAKRSGNLVNCIMTSVQFISQPIDFLAGFVKLIRIPAEGFLVTDFSRFFSTFRTVSLVAIVAIAGCSSPKISRTMPESPSQTPQPVKEYVDDTPESLVARAKQIWREQQNVSARNELLLTAAAMWIDQQDTVSAQQLLFSLERDELSSEEQQYCNLMFLGQVQHTFFIRMNNFVHPIIVSLSNHVEHPGTV